MDNLIRIAAEYHKQGDLQQAEIIYKEILTFEPRNFRVLNYLGNVLEVQHKYDEAIASYQKAVDIEPTFAGSYYHLGGVFEITDQLDNAMTYYEKAIQCDPNFSGSYNNLGNVYRKLDMLDKAIPCFKKAVELNPDFWGSYYNLGEVLQDIGQVDEAISCFQKALQLNPNHIASYNNLGLAFSEKVQSNDAMLCYHRAIQLSPDYAEPHFNKASLLLLLGDFGEGWREYEWRWKRKDAKERYFPQPPWDGSSLEGKTLLVYGEQGVGDEVMFASCLPELIAQAGLCIVECDVRLGSLFSRSFPGARLIERIQEGEGYPSDLPPADYSMPMGSVAGFLRPDLDSFPHQESYLVSDARGMEKWRRRFQELGDGLKIGISWRGGAKLGVRRQRSIVLEQWAELFSLHGVHFINLQYGDCAGELKEVKEKMGLIIHDWEDSDPLKDLDNFAAQISALDLVVSVDNATVHMAGALGKPVWTLLPFLPDWRWMLNRDDSPWYPTMRLFRQTSPGNWKSVIERVAEELRLHQMTWSSSQ